MNTTDLPKKIKRPKLDYLDGLRGLSAMLIAFYHAQLFTGHQIFTGHGAKMLPIYLKPISIILSFGYLAVPVFIVLSGYSLTIPVALNDDKTLPGGFISYIKRRSRRILPPYYFTLGIFILLIYCIPILQTPYNTAWDSKIPLDLYSIITHIFLVHNLNAAWEYKIDGPLWSVATEWQIYFVFPILIYIWKKTNLLTSVFIAIIIGLIATALTASGNLWLLGLFAIGMLGANISFSKDKAWSGLVTIGGYKKAFYLALTFFIILFLLVSYLLKMFKIEGPAITETIFGFLVGVVLVYLTFIESNGLKKPLFLQVLNSKVLMTLGAFSYSIYLIHSPFLGLINLLTLNLSIPITFRWLLMELIAVPISVSVAYLFYLVIEKRYQRKLSKAKALFLNSSRIYL